MKHLRDLRRSAALSVFVALAVAAIAFSAAAPAQPPAAAPAPPAPSSDPALEEALTDFQQTLAAGDLPGAIAKLEVLAKRPDAPDTARAILGGLYAEAGRHEEARQVLEPLAQRPDADPAVLYNAARAARALGDVEAGVGYLERAARKAPLSPAARDLGLIRGLEGRYAEAYVLLLPWVNAHPEDQIAVRAAAAGAVQLERVTEAEQLLARLPTDDPGVQLLAGRLQLIRGEPRAAIATLVPLLGAAPEMIERDVRRVLAEAYVQVGQAADAIAVLEGHVGNDPSLALRLAQAQNQNGDAEAALVTLEPFSRQVLENEEGRQQLDPRLVERLSLEYGRLLVAASRPTEAVAYFELATQANAENKLAWQLLGQALANSGDRERAKEALERYQELAARDADDSSTIARRQEDLTDPTVRVLREAQEKMASGDGEGALETLRAEILLRPNDPRPRVLEARTLLLLERPQEALEAAQRALETAPDDPDTHYVLGTVLMSVRRFDEAESRLRQALELAPEHTAALNDLAVLLLELGRRDEAKALLERALAIHPDDPVAKANLERLQRG